MLSLSHECPHNVEGWLMRLPYTSFKGLGSKFSVSEVKGMSSDNIDCCS